MVGAWLSWVMGVEGCRSHASAHAPPGRLECRAAMRRPSVPTLQAQTNWGIDENTAYQAALAYATAFGTAYSRPWLFLISSSGD